MTIFNKYKIIFNNLINSSNIEFSNQPKFLDWLKSINNRIYNMLIFKNALSSFVKKNHLNKDISIMLLRLMPKIQDFHIYKCHNAILFNFKSGKA